jgi:hypothetical protein
MAGVKPDDCLTTIIRGLTGRRRDSDLPAHPGRLHLVGFALCRPGGLNCCWVELFLCRFHVRMRRLSQPLKSDQS